MSHCTQCGAPLRPNRLTESEACDAANIVRAYAARIREDAKASTQEAIAKLLEDAAVQRDHLADKLEAMA